MWLKSRRLFSATLATAQRSAGIVVPGLCREWPSHLGWSRLGWPLQRWSLLFSVFVSNQERSVGKTRSWLLKICRVCVCGLIVIPSTSNGVHASSDPDRPPNRKCVGVRNTGELGSLADLWSCACGAHLIIGSERVDVGRSICQPCLCSFAVLECFRHLQQDARLVSCVYVYMICIYLATANVWWLSWWSPETFSTMITQNPEDQVKIFKLVISVLASKAISICRLGSLNPATMLFTEMYL